MDGHLSQASLSATPTITRTCSRPTSSPKSATRSHASSTRRSASSFRGGLTVRPALDDAFAALPAHADPVDQIVVVDVYLNSALDAAHIIDISPFHPFQTAGILFDYSELHELYLTAVTSTDPTTGDEQEGEGEVIDLSPDALPVLRIIESRMHPAAARNSPAYPAYPADVNMVGGGRDIEEFKRVWEQEVAKAAVDGDT